MEIVAFLVGIIGLSFGLFCGARLRRWERQLAGARIAVAYKTRVKLEAPLVEWLTWANMLDKDQQSRGRVVYRMGGTSVAILKPRRGHGKTQTKTVKGKQAT